MSSSRSSSSTSSPVPLRTSPSPPPSLSPSPSPSLTPIPPPTISKHSLWPSPHLLPLDAIHADDRADTLLMAICAALVSVDNRALCPKEIAQVVYDNHWAIPPSTSQPFTTIVATIRSHLKRSEANNQLPLLAFYILERAPSKDERRCMGLKPELKPSVKRSSLWFLNPASTGAKDPFEGVPQQGVLRKALVKGSISPKDPFEDAISQNLAKGKSSVTLKEAMTTPSVPSAPLEKKSTGITIKLRIGAAPVSKPVSAPPTQVQPPNGSRVIIKLNPPAAIPTIHQPLCASSSSSSEDEEETEEEDEADEGLAEGLIRPSAMHRRRSSAYAWTSKPTQRLSSIFSTFYAPLSASTHHPSMKSTLNSVGIASKASEEDAMLVDHELWPARVGEPQVVVVSPAVNPRVMESSGEEEEEDLTDEDEGPEDYAEMMVSRSSEGDTDWDPHEPTSSQRTPVEMITELRGRKWQDGINSPRDLSVTLLEDEEEDVEPKTAIKAEQVEDQRSGDGLTGDLACSIATERITLIDQVPTIFEDLSNDSISPATTTSTPTDNSPTELEPITSLADKLGFTSLCETRPSDDLTIFESSPESPNSSIWGSDWQDQDDGLLRRSRKASLADHHIQSQRPIKRLKLDHADHTAITAAIDSPPTPPPDWDSSFSGGLSSGSSEEDEGLVILIDEDHENSVETIGFEDLDFLYDTTSAPASSCQKKSSAVMANQINEEEIDRPKKEESEFLTSASTPKTFFVEPQVRLCRFGDGDDEGGGGKVYMIKIDQNEDENRRKWSRRDLGRFSDEWVLIRRVGSGLVHLPSLIGILTRTPLTTTLDSEVSFSEEQMIVEKDWIELREALELVKKYGCLLSQPIIERFLGTELSVLAGGVGVG